MERVYLFLHLFGVCLLFASLGGLALHMMNGGDKASNTNRKLIMFSHGLALVIMLVAGVGYQTRVAGPGQTFNQGWVQAKLGIWLLMGAAPAIIYRVPKAAKLLWLFLPLLGGTAYYFAKFKPF